MKGDIYTFKILRYDAKEPETPPRFSRYKVRVIPGLTVLTVLMRIRDELDGTLAFRSSCRAATCGSCGMLINGRLDLACRTQIASFNTKTVILEPLPNLDIIKDLVVDMTPFWKMYERVTPYLVRKSPDPEKEIFQSEEDRKRIDQFVNCILCACCYGACEVLRREPGYLGPAALAKLQRFMLDSRDERPDGFLETVNNGSGVWACDTLLRCIEACPKEVRPTDAIVALRKNLVKYRFKHLLGMGRNED
ncbi:MAG: Succinate dehydrogenase iron-sulfur subunit [Syntrophorhabdaceae bacterium PtaU1.Bin034]|nr:MAG: Succinate dehydrogenase iron-sulfur subunit [Syntrophorhabdaceae bacterium PtaU1.Bin034]